MGKKDMNDGRVYLREWREFADMTQAELAERAGTTQNQIGYLESGERGLTTSWMRKLAPLLGTTPAALMDLPPEKHTADIINLVKVATDRQRQRMAKVLRAMVEEADEA